MRLWLKINQLDLFWPDAQDLYTQTPVHTSLTFLGQVVHLMPPGVFLLELLEEPGPGVAAAQEGIRPGRLCGAVPAVRIPPAASTVRVVQLHQQTVHDGAPRDFESISLGLWVTVSGRAGPLGVGARRSSLLAVNLQSRRWWCVTRWLGRGARPLLEAGEIILEGGGGADKNAALFLGVHTAVAYVHFQKFIPV